MHCSMCRTCAAWGEHMHVLLGERQRAMPGMCRHEHMHVQALEVGSLQHVR
jgi:hypothetical protein